MADRCQKAIDVAVHTLVTEAVDQIMAVRRQKQVVTDELMRDEMEQRHSPDTVLTPTCTPPAPVSTSTPANVCMCVIFLCIVQSFCYMSLLSLLDVVGWSLGSAWSYVPTRLDDV